MNDINKTDPPGDRPPAPPMPESAPQGQPKSKFSISHLKKNKGGSEEVALPQVISLLERYGIDIESQPTEKQKESLELLIEEVLGFVMQGFIEIKMMDGQLKVIQHIQHLSENSTVKGGQVIYNEMEGKHQDTGPTGDGTTHFGTVDHMMGLMAMDNDIAGFEIVKQLKSLDRKVMLGVGSLFLSL